MKVLLSLLLAFAAFKLNLSRSLYWDPDASSLFWSNINQDYDFFALPPPEYNNDIDEPIGEIFWGESSEDSTELNKSDDDSIIDQKTETTGDFFDIFSSILDAIGEDNSEMDSDSYNDDDGDADVGLNDKDIDIVNNKEQTNNYDDDDGNDNEALADKLLTFISSLSFNDDSNNKKESSEDLKTDVRHYNDNDISDQVVTPTANKKFEFAVTKSSEEKEESDNVDSAIIITDKDIEDLTALLFTITGIEDFLQVSGGISDVSEETENDDMINSKERKEVEEYLSLFSSILDKILNDSETAIYKKTNTNDDDHVSKMDDKYISDDDNDDNYYTHEIMGTSMTPKFITVTNSPYKPDSSLSSTDGRVSFAFNSITNGDDSGERITNNHRYEIINTSFTTEHAAVTSSPYIPESGLSHTDNNDVIQEYVEIRQNLDNLRDILHTNELNLDKDFYAVVNSGNDDKSMKRFERDIATAQENLNRIRENIDAVQNVKSKLYLKKLVKAALKDVKNISNERFIEILK